MRPLPVLGVIALPLAVVVAACNGTVTAGEDSVSDHDTPTDGDTTPTGTALVRAANTTCGLSGPTVTTVFDGLSQFSLTFMLPVPGATATLLLAEQRGRLVVFARDGYVAGSEHVALDIQSKVYNNDEKGFHSMAFAPDFGAAGGFLYVMYSINNLDQPDDQDSRVERYACTRAGGLTCDVDSGRTVIEIDRPRANHNGGQLFFGGDGYLYVTMGDSGGGGDPDGLAQDLAVLQGKILRIDPSHDTGALHYAIPADNPFVSNTSAAPEIFAYGLRNPWRASYDSVSGRIFLADVGQDVWEEIDIIEAGKNYGWNLLEGTHTYSGTCSTCAPPIYEYQHVNGRISITGGFIYRGSAIPSLYGAYVFADFGTGEVFRLDEQQSGGWLANKVMDTNANITSFGYDDAGEIYALHLDGSIHRIDADIVADTAPPTLTTTGCYSDVANRAPIPAAVPFDLLVPFWSDGAAKKRYVVLPGSATIEASSDAAWRFPVGTILIKEFELQEVANDPTSVRPIETRFLVQREQNVWKGYSYIWNTEKTDATLRDDSDFVGDYTLNGAPHQHVFPSRGACNTCHTSTGGYVLGLRTENVNRDHDYGGGPENQVEAFEKAGLLSSSITGVAPLPRLTPLDDVSASVGLRARSWLAVNCSHCHFGVGSGIRYPDLRFKTTMEASKVCEVINHTNPPIISGSSATSPIIVERAGIRGPGQMPPLATLVVDQAAMTVLAAWIDAMDDTPPTLEPEYVCP